MEQLKPLVSVIIPCRNEVCHIDRCLQSVFAFDPVDGPIEVIAVDGLSDDGTYSILERWKTEHAELRVLQNPRRIVPTAMNIGIQAARGQWIVRLDAHSEYPPNYLQLCLETSKRTGAENVGGIFLTLSRGNTNQAKLVQALTTHKFGVGNAGFRIGTVEGPADTVPYGCYRREVFEAIGFYDERLVRNQDYELNSRLRRRGGVIWCNPAIHVFYYNQPTLRGLLRQAFVTGTWNSWMWYVAPHTFVMRHIIPGIFVLALIISFFAGFWSRVAFLGLGLILIPYSILAVLSSIQQSRKFGEWMKWILPFMFLSYHLTYGAGILWGVVRLFTHTAPVQHEAEPWPGAGRYRVAP